LIFVKLFAKFLFLILCLSVLGLTAGCGSDSGSTGGALPGATPTPIATIVIPPDPNVVRVNFVTQNPSRPEGVFKVTQISGSGLEGSAEQSVTLDGNGAGFLDLKRDSEFSGNLFDKTNMNIPVLQTNFSTGNSGTSLVLDGTNGVATATPTPTVTPGGPTLTPTPTVTPAAPTVGPGTPTTVPTATLTPGPGTPTTVPPTATNTPVTGSTATPTATTTATNTPTTVPTVTIISHDPNFAICNYKPTKVYCDGINIFYNNYNSEVVKLNTSGTEISRKQIPGLTNSLWGIADNGTTIFVVNGFGFFHILNKTDLEIQDQHAIPANCGGSCIYGGLINIVDADNCKVNRYNTSSPYTQGTSFGSYGTGNGQFGQLGGICCDTNGNMYITDGKNKRIVVFDSNGTFVKNFGSATSYFTDVSQVNVNGKSFCFATADSNSIKIYTDENFSKTVTTDDCAGVTNKNNGDNTIDIYYANTNSKKIGKIKIQI